MRRGRTFVGQVFGYLTVISFNSNIGYIRKWNCLCKCGKSVVIRQKDMLDGKSKSCGCFKKEWMEKYKSEKLTTHGGTNRPEYQVWVDMRKRCYDKKRKQYKDYGGRGITVCDRWSDFANFYTDMGPRPTAKHTIERKDNSKNYEPDNCIWATHKQQNRNRRDNIFLKIDGRDILLQDAILQTGVKYSTALYRYHKGYSVDRILENAH